MKKRKSIMILFFLIVGTFLFAGCGRKDENAGKDRYSIYYMNREETEIGEFAYYTETQEPIKVLGELLTILGQTPNNVNYNETVRNFLVTAYSINGDVVQISVDENYKKLSPTTEVLTRAAIVRTLTQIKGIRYVNMKVGENDLTDSLGGIIGSMTADQFVDNSGNEINTYEKVDLNLYFAAENGKHLVKVLRPVEYNSNISLERLVVEKIIGGPEDEELHPTVNPGTKIISIAVKDNICYVNLNKEFLITQNDVLPEVTVYSIVNSLIELQNINKVQISVEGNNTFVFRDTIDMAVLFERNLDILKSDYGEDNNGL